MVWVTLVLSFIISLVLVPIVRKASIELDRVAKPRDDRWHDNPTPTLGGMGIFIAFIVGLVVTILLFDDNGNPQWGLIISFGLMFLLGLVDDLMPISPPTKLVGQILIATLVVTLGYTTKFFTPRLTDSLIAQLPNILLTYVWLVGITNAINLLDNMDGLAGGITMITAAVLTYLFWRAGNTNFALIALAILGSTAGFLVYNFPPARIFMGDSGSQFLGFTLAVLAIAHQPQASNVFAVLGVPTLIFLLPILDTTLVTITRLLRGKSPVQGGRDHTSHRLVAFGLNERQVLMILYGIALISGVVGIAVETLDYWLSLVLVPLLVISLALLAAYLGRLKIVEDQVGNLTGSLARLMVDLTYKRRLLEITLDFFIIGIAYYLAFWINYGLSMTESSLGLFLNTLPVALAGAYISFFISGVYRGLWRYIGVDDLLNYGKSALIGVGLLTLVVVFVLTSVDFPPRILILFVVFLFLGLAASRSSFKILDQLYGYQSRSQGERVLILGGGDAGEMAIRWIIMNPSLGFKPVGILDENPLSAGRQIHGVSILGGLEMLAKTLSSHQIDGVVITHDMVTSDNFSVDIVNECHKSGCWVRTLKLEFVLWEQAS